MGKRYYITTPIYYVNALPHIGTTLTTLASDITARFQRMRGKTPHFLTGTDEHATKVAEAAAAAGKTPIAFTDEIADQFKAIWRGMNIQYDDFIRTTEERHRAVVQEVFRRLREKGHIYLDKYEGWWDVTTETFYKESELVEGKSPDGNEVRWVEEENYFFRLSAFQNQLLEHIDAHPDFILPEVRRNEVIAFIKQGLRDTCVTRKNTGWGIPVPDDDSKVVYVWFDALINYISAIGWPEGNWEEFWPADVEWMGKDILVRFHATLWPAILLGLELPLPKTLYGHGWLLMGGEKISKSKGNVIAPLDLASQYANSMGGCKDLAVDAVRYYCARMMPYETDTTFTLEDFELRYNTELVNDLSNGIHRVVSMLGSFCDRRIPDGEVIESVKSAAESLVSAIAEDLERFRIDKAMDGVLRLGTVLNETIDREKPWDLRKNGDVRLADVMITLAWLVRVLEGVLRPITPVFADDIASLLRLAATESWEGIGHGIAPGHEVSAAKPIYLRIEKQQPETQVKEKTEPVVNEITIEDFMKVQLRVARVLDAHRVEGADKLLKLDLIVGDERRQVLAGIAQQYAPEDIIGKQVVVVANLKPRRLRGLESQGMILAADASDGGAILVVPDREAPEGTSVH